MNTVAEYGVAAHSLYKDTAGKPNGAGTPDFQGDQRLCLAAPHHRAAGRGRQSGGFPREHQAGAVPGPGLLLHAEGQADRAAARRDADRLRLCRAHRCRRHLRRRQGQRPHHAADDGIEERRRGRDHPLQGAGAAGRLGIDRRHRQGARRDPPRHQERHPQAIFGLGARILERAFERAGKIFAKDKPASRCCTRLARKDVEDVLAAVGRGEVSSDRRDEGGLPGLQGRARHRRRRSRARKAGSTCATPPACCSRLPGARRARRSSEAKAEARCRSAASAATCRCASRRRARCPAIASSASCSRAPASPSIRSSRRR